MSHTFANNLCITWKIDTLFPLAKFEKYLIKLNLLINLVIKAVIAKNQLVIYPHINPYI